MIQDLRVAWRFLLKRRTSTAIAVLTLGVTVGVCTIAVGVVDQAFWRATPGDRGAALVTVYNSRPAAPQYQTLSYPDFVDVRDRLRTGVDLAALVRLEATLGGDWPTRVWGELVTGNYFSVVGSPAFAGRLLNEGDDRASAGHSVVIGYELWRRHFGSNPSIIGTPLRLGRFEFTIVGIAAPGFHGPAWSSTEFWIPAAMADAMFGVNVVARANAPVFQTIGRPRDGATIAQLQGLAMFPTSASKDGWQLSVFPALYLRFWPAYRGTVARFLGVFVGISTCILLIACANLGGLLIARAGERQRELAMRQALGATRWQLLRRLVAESVILIVLGAAIGLLFAWWAARLVERVPVPVPAQLGVIFDLRLFAFGVAVSFIASALFTALSAIKGLRTDVRDVLTSSASTLAGRLSTGRALVVLQVALCCTLLTVAGLLARSAWQVERIDVGFDAGDVLMGRIALYDQADATRATTYERLQDDLSQSPLVEAVALEWHPPLGNIRASGSFSLNGAPGAMQSRFNVVSPSYFTTLGIRVLSGREFDRRDRSGAEPVAVINEALSRSFPGDAIGQTITLASEGSPRRIVGIVRDVKYNGITEPAQPFVYLPLGQAPRGEMYVHVRTRASGAAELLRREVRRIDPNLALTDVRTMTDQVNQSRATPRASAIVSGGAAAIAVLLALIGVYGVLMTSVEQRRRELAIRAALGATPREIVSKVVREGLTLTLAGLALGIVASVEASRRIADLLFAVGPGDTLVVAGVPLIVLAVSAIAWLAPARRAASIDPVGVLKAQ